jgi:hypothetical protein
MKKFVAILVVFGLAGVVNATLIDNFSGWSLENFDSDYSNGDGVQAHHGWTTSHQNGTARSDATIQATGIGGTNGASALGISDAFGAATGDTAVGDTHTVRMLFNDGGGGSWNFSFLAIGGADYLTTPASDHIWAQFGQVNGGESKLSNRIADGTGGENSVTYDNTGMTGLGWFEGAISVNTNTGTAEAFYRDVSDSDGVPSGPWVTIGAFSGVSFSTVGAIGFGVGGGYTGDNLVSQTGYIPEPNSLVMLAIGGLTLLRRRSK